MKVLISVVTISLYGISLKAQNANTGIYLTEQDYRSNKLNYVLSDHDKLRLNEFLDGTNINLTYHGTKITLPKTKIFGYRQNNQDFRLYKNESYRILDTTGFLLYSREKLAQGTKGYKPIEKYFYSITPGQPIIDLTVQNLWNSFPTMTGFRYSLQNSFGNDSDLITYDKLSNQYKIKYIYLQQKQLLTAHTTLQ